MLTLPAVAGLNVDPSHSGGTKWFAYCYGGNKCKNVQYEKRGEVTEPRSFYLDENKNQVIGVRYGKFNATTYDPSIWGASGKTSH